MVIQSADAAGAHSLMRRLLKYITCLSRSQTNSTTGEAALQQIESTMMKQAHKLLPARENRVHDNAHRRGPPNESFRVCSGSHNIPVYETDALPSSPVPHNVTQKSGSFTPVFTTIDAPKVFTMGWNADDYWHETYW
jgi:hypothetical protein